MHKNCIENCTSTKCKLLQTKQRWFLQRTNNANATAAFGRVSYIKPLRSEKIYKGIFKQMLPWQNRVHKLFSYGQLNRLPQCKFRCYTSFIKSSMRHVIVRLAEVDLFRREKGPSEGHIRRSPKLNLLHVIARDDDHVKMPT